MTPGSSFDFLLSLFWLLTLRTGKPLSTYWYEWNGIVRMSRGTIFNKERQFVTLPDSLKQGLSKGAEAYPIPEGKQYEYGTAGVSKTASFERI